MIASFQFLSDFGNNLFLKELTMVLGIKMISLILIIEKEHNSIILFE